MKLPFRVISWPLVGGLILAFAAWAFWPRPLAVDLGTVSRGPLVVTLDEEGETRVRERYVVSAPVAGKALRIDLEPGDPVHEGTTVLATFVPRQPALLDDRDRSVAQAAVDEEEAALEAARHERERAHAERAFAHRTCERYRRLAAEEVVAADRLDTAELAERRAIEALAVAERGVERASHRVVRARAHLQTLGEAVGGLSERDSIRLYAPTDGAVLRLLRESAGVVQAGEALLEIGDPGDLEVVADFLSHDAVRITPGARVMIERWGGDGVLAGRVERIEPAGFTKISALGVEEQRVNVIVALGDGAAAHRRLGDGYRVEVRVVLWEAEHVLRLPAGSLVRQGDRWAVFRVDHGRAHLHEVDVGARTPAWVEVREGLSEGDRVVLYPGDAVAENVRVASRDS